MTGIDVEAVLSKLSTKEKIELLSGIDFWHTKPLPAHGVPSLRFTDGPNGARGTRNFNSIPAACFPCGTALGATFNPALLQRAGALMGHEAAVKGAHVLLGPCINMQRSPLGGRGFESLTEDPVAAGLMAAAITRGIQGTGVAACIKHFVCNDQEHQRGRYDALVTGRALREVYLKPFQIAMRDGRPATLMTAYNKVNGTHVSENPAIIRDILREEWGWDGMIMSDWFGTYSTSEAVEAGLDLEMPGPTRWRGDVLNHAWESGKLRPRTLDDRARAVLKLVERCQASGVPENAPEGTDNTPETAKMLRDIAGESIVLLKNEGDVLPLSKDKTTLLVGPNAQSAVICGGGSSALRSYYAVSPWDGFSEKLASKDLLSTVLGTYTHKKLPILGPLLKTEDGKEGFDFKAYNEPPGTANRELAEHIVLDDSSMIFLDFKSPNIKSPLWYATMSGSFTPSENGKYEFGISVYGAANLYVDDKLLIDNTEVQRQGTEFYGLGTVEETGIIDLSASKTYHIRVEFTSAPANKLRGGGVVRFGGGGLRVGCARQIDPALEIRKAVDAAKSASQVVIIAALGKDWESEGADRENMKLAGGMDELIAAVAAANSNTVVVLQTGMPVEMPWLSSVKGLVQAWYGGNEAGNALSDVMFGDVNPSGKLSVTFPKKLEDNPAFLNYRSEGGRTLYGEDVYIGYRFYEAVNRDVLFPFGYGLSYSTLALSDLKVEAKGSGEKGTVLVSVKLAHVSGPAAAEVVQVYIAPVNPAIRRPKKELQGFAKVSVEPGKEAPVIVELRLKYATGYWDESNGEWICEKGTYRVLVGFSSSTEKMQEGTFEVDDTFYWKGL